MAINIQEILHPSDSNQIKWEKVNYNFDQILANGGGPTGQKGTKGIQGSVGQTGAKGDKGDQGIQGETGATSSRWKVIPIDQDGNDVNEYVILKPKLENDAYHPVIFLGDQTFDNINGNNGELQLRSTLTIGKHAVGGASPSSELVTLWHGPHATSTNNVSITISTDDSGESQYDEDIYSGNWTRFTLDETYGSNLSGQEKIEFKIGMDRVVFDTNVSFDDANSTLKLPATQKASDELELGMIRFFGGNFWGYKEDANGNPGWIQFCMAPCGSGGSTGTIEFDDDSNISVGPDGALLGNTIEIGGGDLEIDVNGDPWNGTAVNRNYTLTLNGGSNLTGLSENGGGIEIPYTTGPTGGLLLSDAEFTGPSWVAFSSSDGFGIGVSISTNSSTSGRSGTITISHPNDSNVTAAITISQAATAQTTNAPTYTTTWTVNETVSNATVHVTDSTTSPVDNTDTRVAEAGVTVNRVFYFRPAEGHTFLSPSDISVSASQGSATIDSSLTSLGNIKVNVSHVTNTTNNSITVTASGSAQSTAVEYTQLLASPSPVNEGTDITVTMNGNNIPDGTQVFVLFTGTGVTLQSDFVEQGVSFDSGEGAGAAGSPYGGTGGGFGAGIFLTFSGNTASAIIGVEEDGATEGTETAVLTAYSVDSAGNPTDSLSDTISINDTSTAPTLATVTYGISNKSSQWDVCNQSSSSPRSTTYQIDAEGVTPWTVVRDAIRAHAGNLIQNGTWYKVISSTEPGFTFSNHIINGAYDTPASALTNCSSVTTTTTLAPLEFTTVATSGSSRATGRSYTWSLSGFPQTGHIIRMGIYSTSIDYTITGTSGSSLSYDAVGQAYANFLNSVTSAQWKAAGVYSYTQGNPPGFEPTASWNSANDRLTFNMNWQNSIGEPQVIPN